LAPRQTNDDRYSFFREDFFRDDFFFDRRFITVRAATSFARLP